MIIDWKAHILPGLDKKCESHVKAFQLMIYAKKAGVDKLVAMPFYEAGTDLRQFIEMRDESFMSVHGLIAEDMPDLVLGTEFKYDKELLNTDGVELLKNTPVLLVDFDGKLPGDEELIALRDFFGENLLVSDADTLNDEDKLRLIRLGFQSVVNLSEIHHSKDIRKLQPFVESGFVRGFCSDKLAGHDPYRHLEKTKRRMGEGFNKLCKNFLMANERKP